MLLELGDDSVLRLLGSEKALADCVEEAMEVLEEFEAASAAAPATTSCSTGGGWVRLAPSRLPPHRVGGLCAVKSFQIPEPFLLFLSSEIFPSFNVLG